MSWFTKQAPPPQPQGALGMLGGGVNWDSMAGHPLSDEEYQKLNNSVPDWIKNGQQLPRDYILPPYDPNKAITEPGWTPGGAHAGSDLEMRQPGWNQAPPLNTPQPVPGGAPRPYDPSMPILDNPNAPIRQPGFQMPDPSQWLQPNAQMGSLAALGGGMAIGAGPNLNQSGMVTLRSPDGRETQQVSAQDAAHWLSRGAVRM